MTSLLQFKAQFGTACSKGDTGLDRHAIKLLYQQMHTVSLCTFNDSTLLWKEG